MRLGRYVLAVALFTATVVSGAAATECNDGNECTTNDMCSGGECHGTPANIGCDDGNPCTMNDTCSGGQCAGVPMNGGQCDDHNPCNSGDSCLNGTCIGLQPGTMGADCEGGCGTCQPLVPVPQAPLACKAKDGAEGTACTPVGMEPIPCLDHQCTVEGGFAFCGPQVRVCADTDGNPCTDNCDFNTGQCGRDVPKCVPFCETCNQESGQCQPAHLGEPCDDGDVCTPQSTCQPLPQLEAGDRVQLNPSRAFCQGASGPTIAVPTATATPTVGQATPTATAQPHTPTSTRTRVQGTPTPTLRAGRCVGDCNHDGKIHTNEVVIGAEIALDQIDLDLCPEFDDNSDGKVIVNELVFAVDGAMHGCGAAAAAR